MKFFLPGMAAWGLLCVGFLLAEARAEAPPADGVRAALAEQNAWLSTHPHAAGWKKFLRTDELTAQVAKGDEADVKVVGEILAAYDSKTPGLERPRFASVRTALAAWHAQLSVPAAADLPAVAEAAKKNFKPLPADHVAQARARAVAAATAFERYLGRSAGAAGWKKYIHWDELQAQLKSQTPDAKALAPVTEALTADETGTELPQFTALRKAVADYVTAVNMAAEADLKGAYEKKIDEVVKALGTYKDKPTGADAAAIGRHLAWLEQAGQDPELVRAVRVRYSRPNVYATVSRDFIAAGGEDAVDEKQPVRDNILGTEIEGQAHTTGRTHVRLVPNAERASFEIQLIAQALSNNVGYNGPVTIYSTGKTSIDARKLVWIDDSGFNASQAVAQCETKTSINDIAARHGIVERIAWKRAGEQQGEAEQIASEHAETRVANRMDARAADMLKDGNEKFQSKFKNPLVRRGEFPDQLAFSTTNENLYVKMLHASSDMLAAPTAPPAVGDGYDLTVRAHETGVANFASSLIGGVKLTDERLEKLVKDLTGDVPEELKVTQDKDPWSITFASREVQPVSVVFADGGYKVTIRGQQFTRGEGSDKREINDAMEISATYKAELTPTGSKGVRQGDVVVDFVNKKGQLGAKDVAMKSFIKKKFEAMFKPELVNDGLKLKGRYEKAGKLIPKELKLDSGWVVVGWNLENKNTRTAERGTEVK